MVSEKELYVAIEPDEYRKNKASVLSTQADLLSSVRHLQKLGKLKAQKNNLKTHLYNLFESIKENLEVLEEQMPSPHLPKSISQIPERQEKDAFEQYDEKEMRIEQELKEIREKLRVLNA